jgi:DNA-binding winged helix-turn-helix (wHTH) protein
VLRGPVIRYRFRDVELCADRCTLSKAGGELRLEPKTLDCLLYLIANRDRVVGRDELLAALWPGETVSPAALNQCIAVARKAVGDTGTRQEIIATFSKRGYRFVARVEKRPEIEIPEVPSSRSAALADWFSIGMRTLSHVP